MHLNSTGDTLLITFSRAGVSYEGSLRSRKVTISHCLWPPPSPNLPAKLSDFLSYRPLATGSPKIPTGQCVTDRLATCGQPGCWVCLLTASIPFLRESKRFNWIRLGILRTTFLYNSCHRFSAYLNLGSYR